MPVMKVSGHRCTIYRNVYKVNAAKWDWLVYAVDGDVTYRKKIGGPEKRAHVRYDKEKFKNKTALSIFSYIMYRPAG